MEKKFEVLVIDDNAEMRELYGEVFREAGFVVRTAEDGLAGLEAVNQKTPDVVFTGIIMPRMDGFALTEALKKSVVTASVPVVFLSHLGREEDERRAKEIGVKKFIVQSTTSAKEVVHIVHALLTTTEYIIGIDPRSFDARKLAENFDFNFDFVCDENRGQKLAIKLSVKDARSRTFDAEIVCV